MSRRRRAIGVTIGALLCAMGVVLCTSRAWSTEVGYSRKVGVGAVLGDPTGLSGKFWIGPTNAIDVGVGFYGYGGYGWRRGCFRDRDGRAICDRHWGQSALSLHADYVWQSKILAGAAAQLDWHLGVGGRGFFLGQPCAFECWAVGARGPVGLDLTFTRPSFLEVFMEVAPVFYVAPAMFLAFEGGLGVRGYF